MDFYDNWVCSLTRVQHPGKTDPRTGMFYHYVVYASDLMSFNILRARGEPVFTDPEVCAALRCVCGAWGQEVWPRPWHVLTLFRSVDFRRSLRSLRARLKSLRVKARRPRVTPTWCLGPPRSRT